MKKAKIFFVSIFLFLFIGFLVLDSITSRGEPATIDSADGPGLKMRVSSWTIMVYLDGDNALESAAIEDFLKMAAVGSGGRVNIAAQFARSAAYDARYDDWAGTKRFHIHRGMVPDSAHALMDLGEVDMADPAEFFDFIYWTKTNYPADNYALIFWRGRGHQKLQKERLPEGERLSMEEVKRVLGISGGVEFLGFDHADFSYFCKQVDRVQAGDDYYSESRISHEYNGGGAAQNFQADDDFIPFLLPFDFPFFEEVIPADTMIFISSNGYIDFCAESDHADYSNTSSELANNKRIAPCWADLKTNGTAQEEEDIYITVNPGSLTIRWAAETYGDAEPVNVEAVLHKDGRIQFNYNGGNEDISPSDTPPTIGISKGDEANYCISVYNGETELTEVASDLFTPYPAIIVRAPNGGEGWEAGCSEHITWTNIGSVGNVKIDYSTSGGETWQNIVESIDNTGSFVWQVVNDPSQDCLIRVAETDGDPADISDEPFTIFEPAAITLTSPNGQENWTVGTVHAVTWNSSGPIQEIRIGYTFNNGETWTNIVSCTENDGSYNWTIPDTPSDNCRVRVSRCDNDAGPTDMSDEQFTISATDAAIVVTAPNGGENLAVDHVRVITWTSIGEIGNVNIDYSTNGGETWRNIVASTDNTGAYEWLVPDDPANNCLIKVSQAGGGIWDVSDAPFKIVPSPSITVTAPNGGESWLVESNHNITWTSSGVVGSVKIEYSSSGGETWTTVAATTPNSGSYNWTIPNTPSDDCLVRITAVDTDGAPADASDALFSIVVQ